MPHYANKPARRVFIWEVKEYCLAPIYGWNKAFTDHNEFLGVGMKLKLHDGSIMIMAGNGGPSGVSAKYSAWKPIDDIILDNLSLSLIQNSIFYSDFVDRLG